MADADRQSKVRCPRCGYDLRGVVSAWEERCPLEGVCSECGLRLKWAEVLRPEAIEPGWCVEFVSKRRAFPAACAKTFACCCQPWLFWRRLKMSQPIRGRRLGVYIVFLLVSVYVLFALSQGARAWDQRWDWQRGSSSMWMETVAHRSLGGPTVGGLTVFLHAAVLPFSDSSPGGQTVFYNDPFGARQRWMVDYGCPADFARYWAGHRDAAFFLAAVFAGCPLVFVLLPASRKRAKVRWAHVGRVTAYGLTYPALGAILVLLGGSGRLMVISPDGLDRWLLVVERFALPVMCAGLLVWWCVAIHRYLRMEHAVGVALAVALSALLAASALLFVMHPSFVIVPLSRILSPWISFPS